MKANKLMPAEQLRGLFTYDPTSGVLFWLPRKIEAFATANAAATWNTRYANKPAGTRMLGKQGRPEAVLVGYKGQLYKVHRIIWAIVHGSIPEDLEVDHRNSNPFDNKLDNLRLATHAQNMANRAIRSSRPLSLSGAYIRSRRFRASISVAGKTKYLGTFNSAEEAHAAYCQAAVLLRGEFARI